MNRGYYTQLAPLRYFASFDLPMTYSQIFIRAVDQEEKAFVRHDRICVQKNAVWPL